MWVARDKDGELWLYIIYKPIRKNDKIWALPPNEFGYDTEYERLPIDLFPDLKWEDEPIEVELTKVDRRYIQCDKCGKAFSYTPNEIICIQPSSHYADEFDIVYCPHCKSEVFI